MTPTDVLLSAIADHLRDDVQPALEGFSAYRNRIATNVLEMLAREARLGAARACLDAEFLEARGLTGTDPLGDLARGLRDGDIRADTGLVSYLRERSLRTLAIDGPRYSSLAVARQRWPALAVRAASEVRERDARDLGAPDRKECGQ